MRKIFEHKQDELKELKNQTVNVVGNANILFDRKYGERIDHFPTIRFNTIKELDPVCQGTRWDYLASSNLKTINYYNQNAPKFHSFLYTMHQPRHILEQRLIEFDANVHVIDTNYTEELCGLLDCKYPSTGITILYFLHKVNNTNVNIFGFDWKATKTFYNETEKVWLHDFKREKELCEEMIETNKWNLFT